MKGNETQCKQKQSNPKEVNDLQSAKRTAHPNSSKQIQTRKLVSQSYQAGKQETLISNYKPIMQIMQSRNMINRKIQQMNQY
jgi:hypothetical protein